MHTEPRPQAAVGCPACPFLRPSTGPFAPPWCCSTGSPQPLSRRYAAAYCLTDQHASCGHFQGGRLTEVGDGDAWPAPATRGRVLSPRQTAGGILAALATSATAARAWCARLRRQAPAAPHPPTIPAGVEQPVAASEIESRPAARAARPLPVRWVVSPAFARPSTPGLTASATTEEPRVELGQGHAEAPRSPARAGTQASGGAALGPVAASPLGSELASVAGARLVLTDCCAGGRERGTAFALRAGAVVGRWPGSEVAIPDPYTSGAHACLLVGEGRWWVDDLGSTNGTFVNGARIDRPTPLSDGDEIRFGRVRTRFTVEPAGYGTAPAQQRPRRP